MKLLIFGSISSVRRDSIKVRKIWIKLSGTDLKRTGRPRRQYDLWITDSESTLAYIILMDQFPCTMFRGSGKAFSTDRFAVAVAKRAIAAGWDKRVKELQRQFFYLPLLHSENLLDQELCVRLMLNRMADDARSSNVLHARVHSEVIRRFGRFPNRNDALSRRSTGAAASFVEQGGYGHGSPHAP